MVGVYPEEVCGSTGWKTLLSRCGFEKNWWLTTQRFNQGCDLATVTNNCFDHWPVIKQWSIQPNKY